MRYFLLVKAWNRRIPTVPCHQVRSLSERTLNVPGRRRAKRIQPSFVLLWFSCLPLQLWAQSHPPYVVLKKERTTKSHFVIYPQPITRQVNYHTREISLAEYSIDQCSLEKERSRKRKACWEKKDSIIESAVTSITHQPRVTSWQACEGRSWRILAQNPRCPACPHPTHT